MGEHEPLDDFMWWYWPDVEEEIAIEERKCPVCGANLEEDFLEGEVVCSDCGFRCKMRE